jgi:hypothetical protein
MEPPVPVADNGHRTARRAVDQLCAIDGRYKCPSRIERDALVVAFARKRMTLHAAAFDVVRLERPLDLFDEEILIENIDAITVCEIKSTNQKSVTDSLRGYFFNITAAELLAAQSLGAQYRFLFVNTVSGLHQEMSLNDVMGRARATYPAWHIRF